MSKICSLYRFTDLDSNEFPQKGVRACRATHDYKRFKSLGDAKATIAAARNARKKAKLQKLNLQGSKNEVNCQVNTITAHSVLLRQVRRSISSHSRLAKKLSAMALS